MVIARGLHVSGISFGFEWSYVRCIGYVLLDGSIWTGVRGIDFLFRGTDSRRSSPFGCVSRRHYECKLRNSIVCLLCIIDGVDHVSRE